MIFLITFLWVFLLLYFVKDQRNTHHHRKRVLFAKGVTKYRKYKKYLISYSVYILDRCTQGLTVHTGHSNNILPSWLEKSFCALEV